MESNNRDNINTPSSSRGEFFKFIERSSHDFASNPVCKKIELGAFNMADYHNLLQMIFHQTLNGPAILALAGANIAPDQLAARDYLIRHAAEEYTHWKWVMNDLKATNYKGVLPTNKFPPEPCQAYLAFNYYVAHRMPLARLGIALMLETLGATFAKKYAALAIKTLSLTPEKASFFFGHSDTDVGHSREIVEIIDQCTLSPRDWGWMTFSAQTAYKMYYRMYAEALNDCT